MLRGALVIMLAILGVVMGCLMLMFTPLLGSLAWFAVCVLLFAVGCEQFFTALGRKLNGKDSQEDYSNSSEGSG